VSGVEVTAALVHEASIAYRVEPVQYGTASINLADLDAKMRAVLVAVIPDIERQVREQVAAEIEASAPYEGVRAQRVIRMCAAIARSAS
jgi:hypothetical protein